MERSNSIQLGPTADTLKGVAGWMGSDASRSDAPAGAGRWRRECCWGELVGWQSSVR